MSNQGAVAIPSIPTGVSGLDEVLGGGLPAFSFNIIAGDPGAGKTTLAQQIVWANASLGRPALYFTVLGEPGVKMLRYQQQMAFFDVGQIGREVRILNLGDEAQKQDLNAVFQRICHEVEKTGPGIVVIDSFRTVTNGLASPDAASVDSFVQRLAMRLTSWEVTSFLVGEYQESEQRNPVFTVADGTLWLSQAVDRNSVVRKLRVVKMRGRSPVPGLHTMRITGAGVQVFPRTIARPQVPDTDRAPRRLSTGIPELDGMMGGGIPEGDTVILAGAAGTGKTTFATRFIAAGCHEGEPAVMVLFEEDLQTLGPRAAALGVDIRALQAAGRLRVLYLRPLDLSPDEVLYDIQRAVAETRARRVVIDSLSGFEVALAPTFRVDFRESLYRVVRALTGAGTTMLLTLETSGAVGTDMRFTPPEMSFIADDLVIQRHVEIAGQLRQVLGVVKMRGSTHSRELREYQITAEGVRIGSVMSDYEGVLSSTPHRQGLPPGRAREP